jgi:NAD(P)-dependent dehydrogenase (short-subunit alcohol dehydrogenase family)
LALLRERLKSDRLIGFAALRAEGHDARHMRLDVTFEQNSARVVDAVMTAHGRPDILFNNAGVSFPGNVENITVEIWDRELGVHAKGVFLSTRTAMPVLTGSPAPKIRPNAARWFLYGPHPEGLQGDLGATMRTRHDQFA